MVVITTCTLAFSYVLYVYGLVMNFNLSHTMHCSESMTASVGYYMTLAVPNLLVGSALLSLHILPSMKCAEFENRPVVCKCRAQSLVLLLTPRQYLGPPEGKESHDNPDVGATIHNRAWRPRGGQGLDCSCPGRHVP